jgi:hypothetical protein
MTRRKPIRYLADGRTWGNTRSALGLLLLPALLIAMACASKPSTAAFEEASAAGPSASGQSLPVGYQSYSDPQGSGQLIYAKLPSGSRSARSVMRDSLAALRGYFDGPLKLEGAVSDPQDQVVQVIVATSMRGQPMRGVATAVVAPSGATFGLAFDRPEALKSSFQGLSQKLSQQMPRSSGGSGPFDFSPPKEWTRQTGGDRTCGVDLPTGWRITGCNQGIATVVGPHNELIQLGLMFFVSTLPGAQGMAGPYLQPVPAFSYFVNYSTRVNRQQGINITNLPGRVLEVKPVASPLPNGRGAYLLQEVSSNGIPAKAFALVYTAPNLMAGWSLYTSYVSAPAELFAGEFADMMRIWGSWKVDDRVYLRQMQQTLESMSATRDILQSGTERQMHAYDNLEESMGLIIRGEERVENQSLGGRADVYTQDTDGVLQACKTRGYDCRRVPFNELTPP